MNCLQLETIITELARDQMLEARTREDGLAHVKVCKVCGTRFRDERALTAGLRTFAQHAAVVGAHSRVEARLLSAFREGRRIPSSNAIEFQKGKSAKWSPWTIAAAATILVVSAVGLFKLISSIGPRPQQPQSSASRLTPLSSPPASETGPERSREIERPVEPLGAKPEEMLVSESPLPKSLDRRRGVIREAGLGTRTSPNGGNLLAAANVGEEIATDFLPVTYGGSLSPMDNGQVVRLELPRSVLQSFGLPMNAERTRERVKADVLLGHDGVVRAVRFVK